MTHDQLIHRAMRWLLRQRCAVVITEMASGITETPDAIGFHPGYSVVIECKTSRVDFLSDKHKFYRRSLEDGMGDQRYYLAPKEIIKPSELPEKWGLLYPSGRGVGITQYADFIKKKNWCGEITLLISAIRRIDGASPKGANVRYYQFGYDKKPRATLGVAKEGE